MDQIEVIIEAHRQLLEAREARDRQIAEAVQNSPTTTYTIAKRLRLEFGEKLGLTDSGVRAIVKKWLKKKARAEPMAASTPAQRRENP
jgi:hypothetical protein